MDRRANLVVRFRNLPVPDFKPIQLRPAAVPEPSWLERAFEALYARLFGEPEVEREPSELARTAIAAPRSGARRAA